MPRRHRLRKGKRLDRSERDSPGKINNRKTTAKKGTMGTGSQSGTGAGPFPFQETEKQETAQQPEADPGKGAFREETDHFPPENGKPRAQRRPSSRQKEAWPEEKQPVPGENKDKGPEEPARSNPQSRRYQRTKRRLYFDEDISPGPVKKKHSPAGQAAGEAAGRTAARGSEAASILDAAVISDDGSEDDLQDTGREAAAHTGREAVSVGVRTLRYGKRKASESTRNRKSFTQQDKAGGSRLRFGDPGDGSDTIHKHEIRPLQQKKGIRRSYARAYRASRDGRGVFSAGSAGRLEMARPVSVLHSPAEKAGDFARRNMAGIAAAAACILFMVMFFSAIGVFSSMTAESGGAIATSTYLSSDNNIRDADDLYSSMEDALQEKIDEMEETHPGYDEYNYQVDEITHNPYHLASYLTAKYGTYTPDMVERELKEIFDEQYSLSTHSETVTKTETRTVHAGESLGKVTTSGYCNCSICCGQWAGGPTASGKYPAANHTIAVDASNPFVPMGTHVIMNGREYVVEDTGAFARYGVQFDVYYDSHSSASAHGHRKWTAYLADSNGDKEVEIKDTRTVRQLNIRLTNHDLDEILRSRLKDEQHLQQYQIYNMTYGNRDYLFPLAELPDGGDGSYEVPPEALSDRRFARMYKEARKYLGYPYVWGGSRPSTSFDCSGYVSWVIGHCGNGWAYKRRTAEGLRQYCKRVSASEAKPGDLVFFKGTYNTSGASHVGIYIGNGKMIHCGSPIKITSIRTKYWKAHLYQYGRIP